MHRGRLLIVLLGSTAGVCAAAGGAWADQPTAGSLPATPIFSAPASIVADLPADPASALNTPYIRDGAGSRAPRLALSGCPIDPTKTGGAQVNNPAPPQPGCPIDPTKVGGAQEAGAGPSIENAYFSQYNLSSPIYWPTQGQLSGYSRINIEPDAGDIYTKRSHTGSFSGSLLEIEQKAQYGITDKFNVAIVADEEPYNDLTTSMSNQKTGLITTTKSAESGWENPVLTAGYAALSQPDDPIFLYFNGQYFSNVFPRNGRVVGGAQEFAFGETFGYQTGEYTFAVVPNFVYNDKAGDTHRWSTQGQFEFFDALSDRWSYLVDTGFQADPGSGDAAEFNVRGAISYYVVPQTVQATLVYQHSFIGDSANNSQGKSYRNQSQDVIGISLLYEFDVAPPSGR